MTRLSAHEEPLTKVFSSEYQFSIPEYQRPYAWGTEQAAQLLDDLTDALEREGTSEPYFLGSIVLVKSVDASAAEVIDGQQRLTTLTILLAVLRDLAEDNGLRRSLDTMISEPGDTLMQLQEQPRLTLRSRDRDFFRRLVQNGNLTELFQIPKGDLRTDAQQSIQDNARELHEQLSSWDDPRRTKLARMLGSRTFLVVVSTSDIASAHRVFNVMNSRGLDLSAADIFKSRVIGELSGAESNAYAEKWEDAEDSLGRQAFQDLFLHIRVIYAKTRAQRELLHEFPTQVLDRFLPGRAAAFVDDVLIPYADAYATIENESYSWPEGADEVNAWLRRLNLMDNNDWKPVALWLLNTHKSEPLLLSSLLSKLERLASVMLIQRYYSTPRATRYASLVKCLDAGEGALAREFLISDEDKRSTVQRLHGPIYNIAPVRKYVLLRLNEVLASAPVRFSPKIITVEHVLPQNPKQNSQWGSDFTEEQRQHWVHRLANLVLLDKRKNSEAQNFDFELKKDRYFRSATGVTPFSLTMEVIDTGVWTPESLSNRQSRLIKALAAEWDIGRDDHGTDIASLTESELNTGVEVKPALPVSLAE